MIVMMIMTMMMLVIMRMRRLEGDRLALNSCVDVKSTLLPDLSVTLVVIVMIMIMIIVMIIVAMMSVMMNNTVARHLTLVIEQRTL